MKWVYSVIFELKEKHEQITNHDKIAHEKNKILKRMICYTLEIWRMNKCKHIKWSLDTKCVSVWRILSIYSTLSRYIQRRRRKGAVCTCVRLCVCTSVRLADAILHRIYTVSINMHTRNSNVHTHSTWIYESFLPFISNTRWIEHTSMTTGDYESAWILLM